MSDPTPSTSLLGVFPHGSEPRIREVLAEVGVDDGAIHVGDEADRRDALLAEQVEETREALIQPQAGVLVTKEPRKALLVALPVAAAIGAVLALPLALISFSGSSLGLRLLWYAIAGAAAGGTIAFIVTAAMAAKDPWRPNAAQRGVVVRVDDVRSEVRERLHELSPLRLDLIDAETQGVVTLETEEDRRSGGVLEEVEANIEREQRVPPKDRHR